MYGPRTLTQAGVPAAARVLAEALSGDPVWSWVFADPGVRTSGLARLWEFVLEGAVRYPWSFVASDDAAVAAWIPPGGTAQPPERRASFDALLADLIGTNTERADAVFDALADARPPEPHFYLSLLGTRPAQQGQGIGAQLLTHNLSRIDALRAPAYVESSSPRNLTLYQRLGFRLVADIEPAPDVHLFTLWRHEQP